MGKRKDPREAVHKDLISKLQGFCINGTAGSSEPCRSIWRCLPCDLQLKVLEYMPLLKISELTAVCKSWRSLLQSPGFKERWQSRSEGSSNSDLWVMTATCSQRRNKVCVLMAYSPSLKKYFQLLPLLRKLRPNNLLSDMMKPTSYSFSHTEDITWHLLAGAGPLIVCSRTNAHYCGRRLNYNLSSICGAMVLNILTGEFTVLPDFDYPIRWCWRGSISMLIDSCCSSANQHSAYYIVLQTLVSPSQHLELRIYDSTINSWTYYHESSSIPSHDDDHTISCADFLHYDPHRNILFVWSSQAWSKVQVPCPSGSAARQDVKVLECKGRILLVSSVADIFEEKEPHGCMLQGFVVWELIKQPTSAAAPSAQEALINTMAWHWSEIARTPPQHFRRIGTTCSVYPSFIANGGLICMSSSHEYIPPLVYDLDLDSWYYLPNAKKNMHALFSLQLGVASTLSRVML